MSPAMPVVVKVELFNPLPNCLRGLSGHPHVVAILRQVPPGTSIFEAHSNVLLWSEFSAHPLVKDASVSSADPNFNGVRVLA